MPHKLLFTLLLAILIVPTAGLADGKFVDMDGSQVFSTEPGAIVAANSYVNPWGRMVDIVGGQSSVSSGAGRAKGNAYRVDTATTLNEAEFCLSFTGTQTLTFYVFESTVEFGVYSEIYRDSREITGTGEAWYTSGAIDVDLAAGHYYIIAVSWTGNMTYYYDTVEEQATSFGAYIHGYAIGYDPLPASINHQSNDQAAYHQRLGTDLFTPTETTAWGNLKALY